MRVTYNICKLCIYSECKRDCLWICTKQKKECNELWNKKFDCTDIRELGSK